MPPAEVKDQLLKQIRSSIGDKSWRVRYMAATHFNEVRILLQIAVAIVDVMSYFTACGGSWARARAGRIDWPICAFTQGQ